MLKPACIEENIQTDNQLIRPLQKQQESRKSKYLGSIKEECETDARISCQIVVRPEIANYFKAKPTRKLKFIPKRETLEQEVIKSSTTNQS